MQFPKDIKCPRIDKPPREGGVNVFLVSVLCAIGLIAVVWLAFSLKPAHDSSPTEVVAKSDAGSKKIFPVVIRKPDGPPRVDTGTLDNHGRPVTVSCSTCHATRKPEIENRSAEDLNEFHGALEVAHGEISCLSCHNPTDYDALRLADGSRVEFPDVMTLCAQCHGPQTRDYEHGAHGGFNGHWDLTRGPRVKNNCIDCHNPHLPRFPKMQPTFKPDDRFLTKESHESHR